MNFKDIIEMSNRNSFSGVNNSLFESVAAMNQSFLTPLAGVSFAVNNSILEFTKNMNKPLLDAMKFSDSFANVAQLGMKNFLVQNESTLTSVSSALKMSSFLGENSLNSMRSSGLLKALSDTQVQANKFAKINSIGILSALKAFEKNQDLFISIDRIAKQFEENQASFLVSFTEYQEFVDETEFQESELFKNIKSWIIKNCSEIKDGLTVNFLATMFFMYLGFVMGEFWISHAPTYNECITKTRKSCNMRSQGTKNSSILVNVPYGEEVVVLEDGGRWKKVKWVKDSGEVFEGWMYCNLLQKISTSKEIENFINSLN